MKKGLRRNNVCYLIRDIGNKEDLMKKGLRLFLTEKAVVLLQETKKTL